MENLLNLVNGMTAQQMLLFAVTLLLLLLVLMLILLLVFQKRAAQTERESELFTQEVLEHLGRMELDNAGKDKPIQLSADDMSKTVKEAMVQLMAEATRTQQGQMDSLGGQLRASDQQDEERMERLRHTMNRRLVSVNKMLEEKLSGNEERMGRMQETIENSIQRMAKDNHTQLEQMRLTVDEKLNATVDKRLDASFAAVAQRLEQVTQSLDAMHSLAGSVNELRDTLGGAQPLGTIGDVQLDALLAQMLAPDQYAQHASVRPGGEPVADFVVVMPGQSTSSTVYLPIDAGLPLREYSELRTALETGTRQEVDNARVLLESAVRMHARRMSEKLIAPPYTTDYAVLFLQSEGLFAQVLQIGGLAERIQHESRVVIAGPTTFAALLTSLQMGFRSLAIEQRTQEVLELLGAVQSDFAGFAGLLNRTQKKLRAASEDIENAQKHSETIAKRLSGAEALPADSKRKKLDKETMDYPFEDDDEWD